MFTRLQGFGISKDEIIPQKDEGYLKAHLAIHADNPDVFTFVEEWENQRAVETYMQSDRFAVLQGAMKLLTASSEINVNTISDINRSSKNLKSQLMCEAG